MTKSISNPFMSIDTLKFFDNLVESGMSKATAKVLTQNFRETQEIAINKLATKEDVQNLDKKFEEKLDQIQLSTKEDLKNLDKKFQERISHVEEKLDQKIDLVEQKLDNKIQTLEYKLLTKIGAMLTVAVAAITWINKFV